MKNTISLPLSFAMYELMRMGVTPDEARSEIMNINNLMSDLTSGSMFADLNEEQEDLAKALIMRSLFSTSANRQDSVIKNILNDYKNSMLVSGDISNDGNTKKYLPNEVVVVLMARSTNKLIDFMLSILYSESIVYSKYEELVGECKKSMEVVIKKGFSIYKGLDGGAISFYMFFSLFEDIISTSIDPLTSSILSSSQLRRRFLNDPSSMLGVLERQIVEKLKASIYLSDGLLKL